MIPSSSTFTAAKIITVEPRLSGPQLSECSDYPKGKFVAHAQNSMAISCILSMRGYG